MEFTFGLEKKQMHLFDQFSLMIHVLLAIKKPMKHKKNQPDKSQWCNGSDEMRRKIHVVFRSSGKAEKLSGIPFLDFRGRTEFQTSAEERNSTHVSGIPLVLGHYSVFVSAVFFWEATR